MYSLNRVQLIGNLTRDPELKQLPNGSALASFSIATNHSYKAADGTKQEKSEFHNVVCFGKLAEIAGNYLRKGNKVYVEGRLQTRSWEGQDNVKRYSTEIVLQNLIILTPKKEGSAAPRETGIREHDDERPLSDDETIAIEDLSF